MGKYTQFLEDQSFVVFEKEDYMEELKKVMEQFRSFDTALDTFLLDHGYAGDHDDVEARVRFLSQHFTDAGIPVPRNLREWYTKHRRIRRKTAFQICFAFGLGVEEVDDFLRRICLMRGFDCHCMEEVVYFYAFKKGLAYQRVQELIAQAEPVRPGKIDFDHVVYTKLIAEEIDSLDSEEELIAYLTQNPEKFNYNNAAACEAVRSVWNDIASPRGLALRERKKLYAGFDQDEETPSGEEACGRRKERKRMEDSIWEIYLQILGLAGNYASGFYRDRSIKPMLKENPFLHPLAEDSFPDRDGLTKILNGEHVSHERVRKLLILLSFYRFWVHRALAENHYEAGYMDADRCLASMNDFLLDAGYPRLYAGNPFDFVILSAIQSEMPLVTFREYMRELYFASGERFLGNAVSQGGSL